MFGFEVEDEVLLGGLLGDLGDKARVLSLSLTTKVILGTMFDSAN